MSTQSMPPDACPVESSSSVFTQAEGQVLAHLFAHGQQPTQALISGMGLPAHHVRKALTRLAVATLVFENVNGWDLTLETRGVMLLALEVSVAHAVEGSRHG